MTANLEVEKSFGGEADPALAKVVFVHGINNTFGGPNQMSDIWASAALDGVTLAGNKTALRRDDIECVFFGDIFRPPGRFLGHDDIELTADHVSGHERDLLMLWWDAAARADPAVVPPDARTLSARSDIRSALLAIAESRGVGYATERLLVWWLKQLTAYFTDDHIRAAVTDRLVRAVTPQTRVVVAHSLGSVAAYEALCAHPEWGVTDFITLGSPLGIPNIVLDRLRPAPITDPDGRREGHWPGVQRWVNVSDDGDVVSLQPRLRRVFGPRVIDVSVANGARPHRAERYLSAAETGSAILAGIGPSMEPVDG